MGALHQHIAFITGGGSGIGQAIANGFAREGARVVVADVNEAGARETVRQVEAAGGRADAFVLDVADRAACQAVARQVSERIGKVSVLVNNAGVVRRNVMSQSPELVPDDWDDIVSVNLTGMFNVTHAFLEPLREMRGRVINIGSIQSLAHVTGQLSPAYTTTKHGVVGFTRALAADLGKVGVRVNAIGPGFSATPLNASMRAANPDRVKYFVDHTPLGRVGSAEDMVGPAIFLASDQSAYVTGVLLMVDGGYHTV